MKKVYVIGSYSTPVKKWPDKSHKELVREAYLETLKDAGMENGDQIESVWVGNAAMNNWGQDMVRGQMVFTPIIEEGLLPERVSMFNVESACATASMAFQGAWRDVLAGTSQVALAVGFEKLFIPGKPELTLKQFSGGVDQIDRDRWIKEYQDIGDLVGTTFDPDPVGRSMFMDTYGMQALYHMHKYGTTQRQIAMVAAKNHNNGSLNPFAQYQFKMTVDEVLEDREVVYPLTRAMCAPVADGAAAALLCSEEFYKTLPSAVQDRCVEVAACVNTSGKYRKPDELNLSYVASRRAYEMAGISAEDVNLVELHDATAFGEIFHTEMLGLCPIGEGGKLVESGETAIEGRIPVNTSGGLLAKGHPIGATGLSMISELVKQLRGEAGERQVKKHEIALQENGGGAIGLEEASCSVIILKRM